MPEQHAISVLVLGDGRYRSLCSCNWKGIRTPERAVAEAQADVHMAYHAEVVALSREPAP